MLTWTFAAVIDPVTSKFCPVKVSVWGPVIDDGLTEFKVGVALCAHVNVHELDEHTAELEPIRTMMGIAWSM